ncbi:MAG TPA: copper chaperone PCu(A)C [Gemmatimonadaceae bacterium]|nr:copper chaperone PCu(A)C [Gemmatimonadaceae bacterium]
MQDSIVGVALPGPLGALYRDVMSPYCPGLTLASCPSPQADSLRKAIALRFQAGESSEAIMTSLVADYGPNVRGTPTLEGFGAAAFIAPVLVLVGGGLVIMRWLRRNQQRAQRTAGLAVLLAASLSTIGCAGGADAEPSSASASVTLMAEPMVTGAWARVSSAGTTTGAYGTIHNPEDDTLRIVGATSSVADTVELHETMDHDGMAHMEPRPALPIPPRDSVMLAPGGLHLMVRQLMRDLVIGEQVAFTLHLADGRTLPVQVEVRSADGRTVAAGAGSASGAPRLLPGKKDRGY